MSLEELFATDLLEKARSISPLTAFLSLAFAFLLGFVIFVVYRLTYKGVMYSAGFGVSLIALSLITTLVLITITSNIFLSLGMVGALSIVRFRTAIKEPLDIVFLFWSLAVGIMLGAGLVPLAVFGTIVIGAVLLIFVNRKSNETPYVLVLSCENDSSEIDALELIKTKIKRLKIKSKTVTANVGIELTVEIRLHGNTTDFVNEVAALPGIRNVVLVSYNGVYTA